jgi:hypothetical protein
MTTRKGRATDKITGTFGVFFDDEFIMKDK